MRIDGREIANKIISDLKLKVEELKEENIFPHLLIIMAIEDPQTESYIKQKVLRAEQIGAKITIKRLKLDILEEEIIRIIHEANKDESIHGIIIQRPLPIKIPEEKIANAVIPEKDVDGFNSNSNFEVPVAKAIFKIFDEVNFKYKDKKITVIGKGITAGKPISQLLRKKGFDPVLVDSKTQNKEDILRKSDVIISAVGKKILDSQNLKNGVFLIGVGMHIENGKLKGDYDDEEIKNKASFYTPTPGGVGPINVCMLMKNLVDAAEKFAKTTKE